MKISRWEPLMAVILLVLVYIVSSQAGRMAAGINVKAGGKKPVVVIDAGQPDTSRRRKTRTRKR